MRLTRLVGPLFVRPKSRLSLSAGAAPSAECHPSYEFPPSHSRVCRPSTVCCPLSKNLTIFFSRVDAPGEGRRPSAPPRIFEGVGAMALKPANPKIVLLLGWHLVATSFFKHTDCFLILFAFLEKRSEKNVQFLWESDPPVIKKRGVAPRGPRTSVGDISAWDASSRTKVCSRRPSRNSNLLFPKTIKFSFVWHIFKIRCR